MSIQIFIFISFCGALGIFLRRNILNVAVSLLQLAVGFNAIISHILSLSPSLYFNFYLLFFTGFLLIIFIYSIAVIMIRRRSTLNVNELTELRG